MTRRPPRLRAQRAIDDLGRVLERSRKRRARLQVGHPAPPGVEHATDCECGQCSPRSRPGPKPRAGEPSSEVIRARCSAAEKAEIQEACKDRGLDVSDVIRELLLAWARRDCQ